VLVIGSLVTTPRGAGTSFSELPVMVSCKQLFGWIDEHDLVRVKP
jgi:hypothetical protein